MAVSGAAVSFAETPDQIAEILASDSKQVQRLLAAHPNMVDSWQQSFWADALLRGRQLPDQPWRSHDLRRPQPPLAPRESLQCEMRAPPEGAVVLFDGGGLDRWTGPLEQWQTVEGSMLPLGQISNRLVSRGRFGSATVHVEFATPEPPIGQWQYRGNSGVFLMGLYEIQILDSWKNPVYPDGQSGAVYGQYPPRVNASLPPGHWQCLDIAFTAPRFEGDEMIAPARVTAFLNGVLVQDNVALLGPTGFQSWSPYSAHSDALPLTIQDHGDGSRVKFRSIWVQEMSDDG